MRAFAGSEGPDPRVPASPAETYPAASQVGGAEEIPASPVAGVQAAEQQSKQQQQEQVFKTLDQIVTDMGSGGGKGGAAGGGGGGGERNKESILHAVRAAHA